ncbi:MAG: TonB-dependent receptor [Bacteroidia bacterium]|nr:TonB-dependent receptor [Bacteroidia bacterium]
MKISRLTLITLLLFIPLLQIAQEAILEGIIKAEGNELMVGVSVYEEGMQFATISDINGNYKISTKAGSYTVLFQFIGKSTIEKQIDLKAGETTRLDIFMEDNYELIDAVVVSASKFERKQSEETVSIEVIQGDLIDRQNPGRIDESINKIPGVVVMDGQPQIRGGSGWSYGSGSRVQVLLDGIPILSADAADAKWDMIPADIIQQVEVIKGASSALYGSASMNGIINFQTISPSAKPLTKVRAASTIYGNPKNINMKWWDGLGFSQQPKEFNLGVTHLRKIKRLDLAAGLYYDKRDSYLQGKYDEQYRLFSRLRYRFKGNLKGLFIGLNTIASTRKNQTFILWNGIDSLGYTPLPNSSPEGRNNRIAIDPFIQYLDKQGNKLSFKGRYFNSANKITSDSTQASNPYFFYGDLSYQRIFDKIGFVITSGLTGTLSRVRSLDGNPENSLAGEHDGSNVALYAQVEKKITSRINIAAGIRWEYFQIDSLEAESAPNARVGINYNIGKSTFLRASYGQAYRFPSIAEKFASTNLGGIGVFSNPRLESEKGWTAELGVKHILKFSNWQGYIDLAGFYNRYENMVEFSFGQFGGSFSPPFFGLGFSAQNVGDTDIKGIEISSAFQGNIGSVPFKIITGYYYIDPTSRNWDDTLITYNEKGQEIATRTYAETSSSEENFLKYRSSHSFKADIEATILRKVMIGFDMQYRSYLKNIDEAFVSDLFILLESTFDSQAFSGLRSWREQNEGKGDFVINGRLSYLINDNISVSLLVKNLANRTYTYRPAIFEAPRSYALKLAVDI